MLSNGDKTHATIKKSISTLLERQDPTFTTSNVSFHIYKESIMDDASIHLDFEVNSKNLLEPCTCGLAASDAAADEIKRKLATNNRSILGIIESFYICTHALAASTDSYQH
jgi:hypothetical protein